MAGLTRLISLNQVQQKGVEDLLTRWWREYRSAVLRLLLLLLLVLAPSVASKHAAASVKVK